MTPRSPKSPARKAPDHLVTVCDKCRQASCWQGEFMCQEAYHAGTIDVPVSVLRREARENPEWWRPRPRLHRPRFIPGTSPTRYRCDDCHSESDFWHKTQDCPGAPVPPRSRKSKGGRRG